MKLSNRIIMIVVTAIIAFALIIAGNFLTKGKVEENNELKIENAMKEVYPTAASFDDANYRVDYLKRYLEENGYPDDQVFVNKITFARNEFRDVQGVVVQVSSYKKYGGIITMLIGVQNDGTINTYSILNISDAKGLDLKVKDHAFSDQFTGKRADQFTLVNYESSLPYEIVAANGAEDASQSVVRAVNAAILANTFIDEYYGGAIN